MNVIAATLRSVCRQLRLHDVHGGRPLAALAFLGLACAANPAACGGRAQGAEATSFSYAFSSARAWAHLEAIVELGERPAGSAALERLRGYLTHELVSLGLSPVREEFRADTPAGSAALVNLYVDLPASPARDKDKAGDARAAPEIVLATHIDTKAGLGFAFLGANDGGSSTAVLLELARCLAARPRRVAYRLLFLDGEEAVRPKWLDPDNCYGSRHHVAELVRTGAIASVRACVLLDMVGDAELSLLEETDSDPRLVHLFAATARGDGLAEHFGRTRQAISDDHLRFLDAGVPSIDLIDFDYGPDNAYWHSAEDVLAHCSAESLGIVGRLVLDALAALEDFAAPRAPRAR